MNPFQAAIQQRHDDQRHARTYGMHRSDYFPHRELGIVYYRQGRHPEAIDELTTSLSSVDTAKAKFYLNRARRSFLQQTRRDTAAPRIVFTTPPDGLLTNRLSVTVAGYAEDDTSRLCPGGAWPDAVRRTRRAAPSPLHRKSGCATGRTLLTSWPTTWWGQQTARPADRAPGPPWPPAQSRAD